MIEPTMELVDFRRRYALQPPQFWRSEAEKTQLELQDGFRLLGPAPAIDVQIGFPPSGRGIHGTHRYLWVIDMRGVPYIIEQQRPTVGDALLKHTNLTGGKEAYLGGEMWFTTDTSSYVSGGSGRYPPTDSCQLEEAIRVFESFGYVITSLGWDEADKRAMRYLEDL